MKNYSKSISRIVGLILTVGEKKSDDINTFSKNIYPLKSLKNYNLLLQKELSGTIVVCIKIIENPIKGIFLIRSLIESRFLFNQ